MSLEALVHLRVPAALKNRWVRQSQAASMKLGDWIISRLERSMNVFKVPDLLAEKYHGAGYALAASLNGQLVDIVYVEDVLPEFDGTRASFQAALTAPALGPTVRKLQALGEVHAGMLSSWEFCEL